jgi:thioredoxin reductase/NAD-dependent dihydropyrimidine dehydrogenase PreA subunit
MSDSLLIGLIGLVLALAFMLPFVLRQRNREREFLAAAQRAHNYGLHEPVSLHPIVDPELCICTGNCVAVCPEDVIGIRGGQAVAIAPASCIGHGLCERSCPVEAVRLVFGTEKRGVELPRIRENFETNVPGLYIIGELGGMGLIRNAFEQGRQCVAGLARAPRSQNGRMDLAIVGCGPAGLAAALHAQHHGLRCVVLEKEDVGGTVRHYPRKKIVMTESVNVPGYGRLSFREIQKEELIDIWCDIVARTGLVVNTGETVQSVRPVEGGFRLRTSAGEYDAARTILAIGRRGVPRKLGVPGEDAAHVAYALREPEAYRDDRILVVGGGDSAVEAALALAAQPGNRVTMSYRGTAFARIKERNREQIEAAQAAGRIEVHWSTTVTEIAPGSVRLSGAAPASGTTPLELGIDRIFVFIGGELPTAFLRECGVQIDVKFGTP